MRRTRTALRILVLTTAALLAVVAARKFDPVPEGLRAQYFANAGAESAPVLTAIDRTPSTDAMYADWVGGIPQSFTAVWTGALFVPRDGAYAFGTIADQPLWIEIDGHRVADNPGGSRTPIEGPAVSMTRGAHPVVIRYVHNTGVPDIQVFWRPDGDSSSRIPSWVLRPRELSTSRFLSDRGLDLAMRLLLAIWTMALLAWIAGTMIPALDPLRQRVIGREAFPFLVALVTASGVLNAIGLTWGLPGGFWVGDELTPFDVLDAASHRFAHGWFTIYPPLHYVVLAVAYVPILVLNWLGVVQITVPAGHELLAIAGRSVSLAMAAATLVATFLIARRSFGWRSGLCAAALLALSAPFVYYAKTSNVDMPYVCWLSIAAVFYLRALDTGGALALVAWAMASAAAMCTKDQAVAFVAGMTLVIVYERLRADGWGALVDKRLLVAAAAGIAVFVACTNLVFNATGFIQRLQWIAGGQIAAYREFQPTVGGHLSLITFTGRLLVTSLGWPSFVLIGAGIAMACSAPSQRRTTARLLVPAIAYDVLFIEAILYNYDRFLLPVMLVLVPFGGLAIDRLTAPGRARLPRIVFAATAGVYAVLSAVTVDILMVRDSRYGVERWLEERVGRNETIGVNGLARYQPRVAAFRVLPVEDLETLTNGRPRYFILNADYTRLEPRDTPVGQLVEAVEQERTGYRLVQRARTPSPWPWLPGAHPELTGDRRDARVASFLRNINPTIEVYEAK